MTKDQTPNHRPAGPPTNRPAGPPTIRPAGPPTIPGLTVGAMVGRGGNAAVHAGHQHAHDRPVAVKVLDARLDETARRRFDRERSALGRVSSHPNVVTLIESGTSADGRAYLVLEWAPGGALAARVNDGGRLGLDEVTACGIQLAAALEHAHRNGVVHCDVTPGNIVRSEYGDWLLTDFGVAAFTDGPTRTETVKVTFAHCAPESLVPGAVTPAADVYSLASVLRTMLTGDEPNAVRPGETMTRAMARIASTPIAPITEPTVDRDLARLVQEALSHDPTARPASMREFAARLARCRADHGLAPIAFVIRPGTTITLDDTLRPGESAAFADDVAVPRQRRQRAARRRLAGVAAAAVVAAGGGVAMSSVDTGVSADALTAAAAMTAMVVEQPDTDTTEIDGDEATEAVSLSGDGDGDGERRDRNGDRPPRDDDRPQRNGDGNRDGNGDGDGDGG